MAQVSARARALIEALHEPTSNEERWEIAERFLGEARRDGMCATVHVHRHRKHPEWEVQCYQCSASLNPFTYPWLGTDDDERTDGEPSGYRYMREEIDMRWPGLGVEQ